MSYTIFFDRELQQPTPYTGEGAYFKKSRKRLDFSIGWARNSLSRGRVLDIGASPFYLLDEALRFGAEEAHGVYFTRDEHPLKNAAAAWSENGKISLYHLDTMTEKLPFEDESIDTVTLFETLEHFFDFPFLLTSEVNRVLKPGGEFLITVPNACSWGNILGLIRGKNVFFPYRSDPSGRHHHEYTQSELREYLQCAGMSVKECRNVEIPGLAKGRLGRLVSAAVRTLPPLRRYGKYVFGRGVKERRLERVEPPLSLYSDRVSAEL